MAEANSEENDGDGSPILSGVRDLRIRALKGHANRETPQQTIPLSAVQNVTDRKPVEMRLKQARKSRLQSVIRADRVLRLPAARIGSRRVCFLVERAEQRRPGELPRHGLFVPDVCGVSTALWFSSHALER